MSCTCTLLIVSTCGWGPGFNIRFEVVFLGVVALFMVKRRIEGVLLENDFLRTKSHATTKTQYK